MRGSPRARPGAQPNQSGASAEKVPTAPPSVAEYVAGGYFAAEDPKALLLAADLAELMAFNSARLAAKSDRNRSCVSDGIAAGLIADLSQNGSLLSALIKKTSMIPPSHLQLAPSVEKAALLDAQTAAPSGSDSGHPTAAVAVPRFQAQCDCLMALSGDWAFLRRALSLCAGGGGIGGTKPPTSSGDVAHGGLCGGGLARFVAEVAEGRLTADAIRQPLVVGKSSGGGRKSRCCCNVRCTSSGIVAPIGLSLLRGATCQSLRGGRGQSCFAWFCSTNCLSQARESGHAQACSYLASVQKVRGQKDSDATGVAASMGGLIIGGDRTRALSKEREAGGSSQGSDSTLPLMASQTRDDEDLDRDEVDFDFSYLQMIDPAGRFRPYSETRGQWVDPREGQPRTGDDEARPGGDAFGGDLQSLFDSDDDSNYGYFEDIDYDIEAEAAAGISASDWNDTEGSMAIDVMDWLDGADYAECMRVKGYILERLNNVRGLPSSQEGVRGPPAVGQLIDQMRSSDILDACLAAVEGRLEHMPLSERRQGQLADVNTGNE